MKRLLFLVIICLTIITVKINAQPQTVLTLTGGYVFPMGDLKGNFGDTLSSYRKDSDSNTYFIKNGVCFGLNIKISLIKNTRLKFLGGINYSLLSNRKDFVSGDSVVKINNTINVLAISSGIEYMLLSKKSKVNPFISASIAANLISGSYEEQYFDSTKTVSLKSTLRLGFEVNSGVDIVFSRRIGIIAGVKFNYINLLLRSYNRNSLYEYNLNDKENVSGTLINNKKNMFNFIIYAGVSLYLGI